MSVGQWLLECNVGVRERRQVVMAVIITHCTVTTVPHHTVTSGLSQPSEPEPSGERERAQLASYSTLQELVMVKG